MLCALLSDTTRVVAAAPLKVAIYSRWVYLTTGWQALIAVYAFFILGASSQRFVLHWLTLTKTSGSYLYISCLLYSN